MKILRRIFPWNTHEPDRIGKIRSVLCFDYEIGLCPGTCIGAVTHEEYIKNIERLKLFFEGKKKRVIAAIEQDMARAARTLDFEKAAKLRHQLFALKHIRDMALISDPFAGIIVSGEARRNGSTNRHGCAQTISALKDMIYPIFPERRQRDHWSGFRKWRAE